MSYLVSFMNTAHYPPLHSGIKRSRGHAPDWHMKKKEFKVSYKILFERYKEKQKAYRSIAAKNRKLRNKIKAFSEEETMKVDEQNAILQSYVAEDSELFHQFMIQVSDISMYKAQLESVNNLLNGHMRVVALLKERYPLAYEDIMEVFSEELGKEKVT